MIKYITVFVMSALMIIGCSSSDDSSSPSIHGDWIFINDAATAGIGATFNPDGTYSASVIQLTSMKSARAELEIGVYSDDSHSLTAMPTQSTCVGIKDNAATNTTMPYQLSVDGNFLTLVFPDGAIKLTRNNASSSDSFLLQYGCFNNGEFFSSELKPTH